MKNNNIFVKKLISCLVAFVASCSLGIMFSSCSNDKEIVGTVPKGEIEFSFSSSSASIILGEERLVAFSTEIPDLTGLTFTSSDENIATVMNYNGHALVQTLKTGNVVITATLNEFSSVCEINVNLGGMQPVLMFEEEKLEEYNISINDVFELDPYVYFNGKKYYDVESTYSAFDTAVVEKNEEGNLVAKAKGQTDVTATYTWRGLNLMYGEQKLTLQVKDRIEFIVNNGKYGDEITLYTTASHEGNSFDTETVLDVKVCINGVEQNEEVKLEILNGGEFVALTDKKLTSNATVGDATLRLSTNGATSLEKEITVKVRKPLAVYNGVLDFSTDFGTISTKTVFGRSTKIVEAYQNGRELEIVDGKILGVTCTNKDKVSSEIIEIYNSTVGYQVKLNAYLAKISTADEFIQFFSMRMPEDFLVNGVPKEQYYTTVGYVELIQDIDLTGLELQTYKAIGGKTQYNNACAFEGVFDGKGHTVKGLTFSKNSSYGLFGNLSEAIVRNVAFTEVAFNDTTSNQALFGAGIVTQQMGVIQDVYVSIKEAGNSSSKNNGALLVGSSLIGLSLKNILVEYPDITANDVANNGGSLFGIGNSNFPYLVKNVFVVSKTKRLAMKYETTGEADYYVWVAKNDATKESDKTVTIDGKEFIIPHFELDETMSVWGTSSVSTGNALERRFVFDGVSPQVHFTSNNQQYGANGEVIRFDDYEAMSEAKLTYSDFINSGFWQVSEDNILSWGVENSAWEDDNYNPSDDDDSWSDNWNPEGDTIG